MLSLTHDMTSHWTTALLAGESIVYGVNEVDNITDFPLEILSPCAIIQSYLMLSTALWTSPLTLPCIILTHHLKRLQQQCREDLTRQVIRIEEQLGVTGVGRRNIGVETSSTSGRISKNFRGKPVERAQAEFLTVKINTELTRLLFTGHAPKWNYKASELLLGLINEMEVRYEVLSSHEISDMLEHNIILAQSLEDHLLGLQKRLELQLDVCTFSRYKRAG
ncbi:hypothetical protein BJX61DRAFT_507602 [Aspergillus egyptiacus]|nr:hypothetical protein BJX61DRAFT_507602 [Aspergillus egyptiacus]